MTGQRRRLGGAGGSEDDGEGEGGRESITKQTYDGGDYSGAVRGFRIA